MHHKTYFVQLRRPFGELTPNSYMLYIHADTPMDAVLWVEKVFDGLNVQPLLRKLQAPVPTTVRIGCNDSIVLHDCDHYPRGRNGEFRRSEEDVTHELLRVFNNLEKDRTSMVQSFVTMSRKYNMVKLDEAEPYFEKLANLKSCAHKALVWQTNLWSEYLNVQQQLLVMPKYHDIKLNAAEWCENPSL